MKKLLGIVVLGLLFGISANAQPSSEYLGNDEWFVKYSSNCTYKGALKGIGKKKGLFKTKQTQYVNLSLSWNIISSLVVSL